MGKTTPYPNPHLNPNPNPKKKSKQFHHHSSVVNGRVSPAAVVNQTTSDDAYSFNQRPNKPSFNTEGSNSGGYLTYNVALYTRDELHELRNRLVADVERVRALRDRIESGKLTTITNNNNSSSKSFGKLKKLTGNVKTPPFESTKKLSNGNLQSISALDMENLMKECRGVLSKLMKQKNGWIFNKPVDAELMGLHDYHEIVKQPMDLGTVKSKLGKGLYPTPIEFAADVRLTFNNALLYNPKTDNVHGFADQLLAKFEELYRPIQEKIDKLGGVKSEVKEFKEIRELPNHIPNVERPKKPKASPVPKKQERMQSHSSASTPSIPMQQSAAPSARQLSPVSTSSPMRAMPVTPQVVAKVPKQPKPKAKDPNKREMSMEEKHKLGVGLQSLPQEKMPQLVQIIRKRNEHLAQEGDEIELDIEALDTETLWELDRFVTNWKKFVSKTKRQALIDNLKPQSTAAASSAASVPIPEPEVTNVTQKDDSLKKPKKGVAEEEDVDIDDDMPVTSFPPVEIEKDEGGGGPKDQDNRSSSSSSSGSSGSDSSSSDSDSGSSSGSDSDTDDAQS